MFQEKRDMPNIWTEGWCQHCEAPLAQGFLRDPDPCHCGTEVCTFGHMICKSPPDTKVWQAAQLLDMDYETKRAHYVDPPTRPVNFPQPKHAAFGSSGAAALGRASRRMQVKSGNLCPFIDDLRGSEKQYRRAAKRGMAESVVQAAKTKVYDFHNRVSQWHWQWSHPQGAEMSKEVQARFERAAQVHADKIATNPED